jgi:Putative death-receptor fusion protein (DUF2428)
MELTNNVLAQLIEIANTPLDVSELEGTEPSKWDLPQVHAQNAMRALFTEFRTSQASLPFIESVFAVALRGFSSDMYESFLEPL